MTSFSTSLILASGSSARRTLLENAGLVVQTRPVDLDEETLRQSCEEQGHTLSQTAIALADAKANLATRDMGFDELTVAADQILDLDGVAFAKPGSVVEAAEHLRRLRGQTHVLRTAVVLYKGGEKIWEHLASPRLTMRNFSEDFLKVYLEREGLAILSCVGAYRLEGPGIQLFSAVEGTQDAVMGLPLLPLLEELRELKVLVV
ncbi:Maf family protein [Gluconobacter sphaericus]|uniref:Nucleoside triphosphate pyrophosphatase n=1 Tax=Gluconobacter sphaericus NBRC 12467 TaxID=1307951 RepID=A0AA37SMN7_9PROT|nr:Maf family protein [Gluconobacter sphaericus]MBF0886592.1 septum formation protein Maf [Gluconobacter sphaericus]GBR50227.1 septum formation inhibitor nucleotide-binding protein Maf [Gluconobacter sphaericus NBRC 12467]GEB43021.1 Maf-like protein [Gluconobacter sphaericus NBRC 12467]GLQ85934.1 Maf-like protein [Gluconobacter sphaericus NBRC 12467]